MDRPIEVVLDRLARVKANGRGWLASCPVPGHGRNRGDQNPSLSISEGEDGRVLLYCHAGCAAEDVVRALGLTMRDLFPRPQGNGFPGAQRNGKPHSTLGGAHGTNSAKTGKRGKRQRDDTPDEDIPDTVTVESLAKAKGLPVEFVGRYCEQLAVGKIRIVYRLPDGSRAPRHRIRRGTPQRKKVIWEGPSNGPKPVPYGLDRLDDARKAGYLVVVEGETDAWTCWFHGFPALGLPGASMYNKLMPEYLDGIGRLYIWREPDNGGAKMVEGVARRLVTIGWRGQAYVVKIEGVKDPNELHLRDPDGFSGALKKAMTEAEPLQLPGTEPAGGWPGLEHFTDLGNAKRFVRLHGQDIRYVPTWAKWYVWDGTRWAEDTRGRVMHEAEAIISDLLEQAARIAQRAAGEPDPDRRAKLVEQAEAIVKWAHACEARSRLEAAVALARFQPGIALHWEDFDADPWLLNCANGTLDLRTGELRPHRREDLITKSTGVPYDPNAKAPLWEAFLDRIMDGNQELIGFLQRAAGMSLAGVIRDHVLLICYGTGANGKSTFLEALCAALGEYAMTAAPDLLMARQGERHPTELADLFGKRLVVAVESDEGRRLSEALVKRLTGGDTIKARRMREDFWSFSPSHTLWMATNHKPIVRGTDYAIWRRIRLVPFRVTIPPEDRDPDLPAKLRQELPGILAWAVRGCMEWQRHGLDAPREVLAATSAYRAEMDVLATFLAEECVVHPAARVKASDLYGAYSRWCEENGERPLSQRGFGVRLAERGFERFKSTGGRFFWLGIGLAAAEEDGGSPGTRVDRVDQVDSNSGSRAERDFLYSAMRKFGPLGPLSPLAEAAPARGPGDEEWEEGEL